MSIQVVVEEAWTPAGMLSSARNLRMEKPVVEMEQLSESPPAPSKPE